MNQKTKDFSMFREDVFATSLEIVTANNSELFPGQYLLELITTNYDICNIGDSW